MPALRMMITLLPAGNRATCGRGVPCARGPSWISRHYPGGSVLLPKTCALSVAPFLPELPRLVARRLPVPPGLAVAGAVAIPPVLGMRLANPEVARPVEVVDLRVGAPPVAEPVARAPVVVGVEVAIPVTIIAVIAGVRTPGGVPGIDRGHTGCATGDGDQRGQGRDPAGREAPQHALTSAPRAACARGRPRGWPNARAAEG